MAIRTDEVPAKTLKGQSLPFRLFATKAWRLGVVILLGVGLWLALRWVASARQMPDPALQSFWADGGGEGIEVLYAPQEYFRLTRDNPATLGLDPSRELIFFLLIDTHEHDETLPDPATWWDGVSLRLDDQSDYRPWKKKLVLDSSHHQTIALAFQPDGEAGNLLRSEGRGLLSLVVPDAGDSARTFKWQLPLFSDSPQHPWAGSLPLSPWAFLPLLGGLLVAFSPCLIHMGTYYMPLFGGLQEQRLDRVAKLRTAWAAGLFALGFTIPYSVAGIAVGYAGQFAKDSTLLKTLSQPMAFITGAVVIYFGLQVAGIFRLPFLMRLRLPALGNASSRPGYWTSSLMGLNLAVGCMGCVGGSLFAGMLLYSGTVGSPLEGGVTLFLFGLAVNAPFFLAAMTLGRLQLRQLLPLPATRYIPLISGAILITVGLLILSGTESALEDALIQVMGLGVS